MQGQAKEKQGELHLPAFLSSTHFKSEECFYVIIVHEPVCVVEIKFNFTLHVQFQDSVPSIIINERITGLFIDATPYHFNKAFINVIVIHERHVWCQWLIAVHSLVKCPGYRFLIAERQYCL